MGKSLDQLIREGLRDEPIERDLGEVETARGRLAAFLAALRPDFRRLLVGDTDFQFTLITYDVLSRDELVKFESTAEKYRRLLEAVVREWKKGPQHALAAADFDRVSVDHASRGKIRPTRPGPKHKAIDVRKDVVRYRDFVDAKRRLSEAFQVKAAGKGYRSGQDEIAKELRRLRPRLTTDDIKAVLSGRTLDAAARHLMLSTMDTAMREDALRASISRGKRLLESERSGRPNK